MTKIIITGATCAALLWVGTAQATLSAQQKCEQAKLKAQGKLESCLEKSAAGVIGGKADVSADCQMKFTAALAKADAKATKAATSCRYLDNGDGSVSDLNTGLMWEKKTTAVGSGQNAADPHDVDNFYTWSSSGTAPDGTAFTTFLGTLNDGASTDGGIPITGCFANHCDWRLPTIVELQGIVDLSAGPPRIDPAFGSTQSNFYWSANAVAGFPDFAWLVLFDAAGV